MQFESDEAIQKEYDEHQKNLSSLKHSLVDSIDHVGYSFVVVIVELFVWHFQECTGTA